MGIVLSCRDVRRLRAASRALLSPLEHASLDEWGAAVNASMCQLLGAQRAALVLPRPSRVRFILRDFDPDAVEPYERTLTAAGPGANQYADPVLDRAMASLARAGVVAWTTELGEHLSGIRTPRIPFFHDVLIPCGLGHMAVVSAAHDHGMALCAAYHDGPRADPFGEGRLALMELLAPSLEAGVRMLDRLEAVRGALDALLDEVSEALLVCDPDGRELHRNRALGAMLRREVEPERKRVVGAMRRLACTVARLGPGTKRAGGPAAPAGSARVTTERHGYALHAGLVGPGVFGRRAAVVVSAQRSTPLFPRREKLMERCGLTSREADVAIRMARGRSNAEIASDLCRSPHTIRHHAEQIFRKLGVRTRKALALRLLEVRAARG